VVRIRSSMRGTNYTFDIDGIALLNAGSRVTCFSFILDCLEINLYLLICSYETLVFSNNVEGLSSNILLVHISGCLPHGYHRLAFYSLGWKTMSTM
jgi:hypothetical protein